MLKVTVSDQGTVTVVRDADMDNYTFLASAMVARLDLMQSVCRQMNLSPQQFSLLEIQLLGEHVSAKTGRESQQ